MNSYSDSNGKRYTTPQIERKIKKAALELLDMQFLEFGYNFCQCCQRSSGTYLDVSHTISRANAKRNGIVEVLWDYDNLEVLCRKCHVKKDGLGLNFNKKH